MSAIGKGTPGQAGLTRSQKRIGHENVMTFGRIRVFFAPRFSSSACHYHHAGAETRTTVPRPTSIIRIVRVVIQANSRSKSSSKTGMHARHSTASRKTPMHIDQDMDLRPSLPPIQLYAERPHAINAASQQPPSHARRTIKQTHLQMLQQCEQASDRRCAPHHF